MKNIHRINGLIYITSEEEIKDGVNQWYIDKVLNEPYNSGGAQYASKQDIIILTNDPALISDGIQAIEPDAVKWLNENPSCEWVDVDNRLKISSFEKGFVTDNPNFNKINLPKSQTIEEAAETYVMLSQNTIGLTRAKSHAEFAKSQAARDYWFKIFESERKPIEEEEEEFIEALFLEFQKDYDNTQPGQFYPRWFDQEELTRILTVVKTFIK